MGMFLRNARLSQAERSASHLELSISLIQTRAARSSISPLVSDLFFLGVGGAPELVGANGRFARFGQTGVYLAHSSGFYYGVGRKYWVERAFRAIREVFGETSV